MQQADLHTAGTIHATRTAIADARCSNARIALVPTMGNLHDGHLSLVDAGKPVFLAAQTSGMPSVLVNPLLLCISRNSES